MTLIETQNYENLAQFKFEKKKKNVDIQILKLTL